MKPCKLFFVSLILLWPAAGWGAAAHVQTVTNQGNNGTVTRAITTTAGNGVVVVIVWNADKTSVGTFTQTAGDTTALACEQDDAGMYSMVRYDSSVAGGATTFTFTATSNQWRIWVTEISGQDTSSMFDKCASTTFVNSTTVSTGTTATLSQADEIAIAAINADASGPTTVTSWSNSFTTRNDSLSGAQVSGAVASKVVSATTGVTTTLTAGDSLTAHGIISTYKAAVAVESNSFFRRRLQR